MVPCQNNVYHSLSACLMNNTGTSMGENKKKEVPNEREESQSKILGILSTRLPTRESLNTDYLNRCNNPGLHIFIDRSANGCPRFLSACIRKVLARLTPPPPHPRPTPVCHSPAHNTCIYNVSRHGTGRVITSHHSSQGHVYP